MYTYNKKKPLILMIADVPDWIFSRHCSVLSKYLEKEFEFDIKYKGDKYCENDYDLIYPLEWNLVDARNITTPNKYVTGIRSHLSWNNFQFISFVDYLKKNFSKVHVVSKRLENLFKPFLHDIEYITHGVDLSFFNPDTSANLSGKGKIVVGWAGNRVNPQKGFEEFIRPLNYLKGVQLKICGFMDENFNLDEMKKFYESIDIYVCASKHEGNNNSLLEAAAMRRAIITTECGTVGEYLTNGKNAIIIERDLSAFIDAVKKLRDDPKRREEIGNAARNAVKKKFDWKIMANDYCRFFKSSIPCCKGKKYKIEKLLDENNNIDRSHLRRNILSDINRSVLSDGIKAKGRKLGKDNIFKHKTSNSAMVSIILPTYNRKAFLERALQSIKNQTFTDFQVVVVNDCGIDVHDIIQNYKIYFPISYICHTKNSGLSSTRNTGINAGNSKYIAYLDDDDLYYSNHLEELVRYLEEKNEKVAYTDAARAWEFFFENQYFIVKKDFPYSYDFDNKLILNGNFIPVLCVMHQRECLSKVGYFDESLTAHEDWDLWMRMSRYYDFAHIKKVTCQFSWRQDGTTMTQRDRDKMMATWKIVHERGKKYQFDTDNHEERIIGVKTNMTIS